MGGNFAEMVFDSRALMVVNDDGGWGYIVMIDGGDCW